MYGFLFSINPILCVEFASFVAPLSEVDAFLVDDLLLHCCVFDACPFVRSSTLLCRILLLPSQRSMHFFFWRLVVRCVLFDVGGILSFCDDSVPSFGLALYFAVLCIVFLLLRVLFRLDTSAFSVRLSFVVPRGPSPSRLLLLPSQRSMLVFGVWFPSALVRPSSCMAFFLCDDLLLYLNSNSEYIGWLVDLILWYPLLSWCVMSSSR